jgi:hypothetical protein
MTEDEVEQVMRQGLARRAAEVDVSPAALARVRPRVSPRRRARSAVLAAAAGVAAVALTAAVVDVARNDGGRSPGPADGTHGEPAPTQWRTEYWHDLQVEVPADWGWGSAPVGADLPWCGAPGAEVEAGGRRLAEPDPTTPYVGRPFAQTDLCQGEVADRTPAAPYVWLGASLEPGTTALGDGYVRETRRVNGSTVSVATKDPALRRRILDSATGGETCFSELDAPPAVESMLTEGMGRASAMRLCAYRRTGDDRRWDLVYAADLGGRAAESFASAVGRSGITDAACPSGPSNEYVVLTVSGDDPYGDAPVTQDYVVDLGCPSVELVPGKRAALTPALVEPWAVDGIATVLVGPTGGPAAVLDHFIGMQG